MNDTDILEKFCFLFRGNCLAKETAEGDFRPWRDEDDNPIPAQGLSFLEAIQKHLWGDYRIGVYPLMEITGSPKCNVAWLAIDWDEGEPSLVHALNVQELLFQLDVVSFVESSRSKGYHLWVFLDEDIPAQMGRNSMMTACQIVDAPTKEVYPKQVTMPAKGYGNGIRLPYAQTRPEGRQEALRAPQSNQLITTNLSLEEFIESAHSSLTDRQKIVKLASLYEPPATAQPIPVPKFSHTRVGADFKFVARDIWDNGPKHNDRSLALFSFACSLFRQRYSENAVLEWTRQCDLKWGQKFATRGNEGEKQLYKLVTDAYSKMR